MEVYLTYYPASGRDTATSTSYFVQSKLGKGSLISMELPVMLLFICLKHMTDFYLITPNKVKGARRIL